MDRSRATVSAQRVFIYESIEATLGTRYKKNSYKFSYNTKKREVDKRKVL